MRVERTGERLSDGRYVAAPAKVLGTHRNDLEGDPPPTGRFLVVHVVFYRGLDPPRERLWRIRAFFYVYDAAQQLGHPAPPRHRRRARAAHAARLRAQSTTVIVPSIPGWSVHSYLTVPALSAVHA